MKAWYEVSAPAINQHYRTVAQEHSNNLTKPNGSLGMLEVFAIELAAMQATAAPSIDSIHISIFAADHGVAEEGVSAFPQAVTAQMVRNFSEGGAAICVLAKQLDASFEVINVGTVSALEALVNVRDHRIAAGTDNMVCSPAMSAQQLQAALTIGKQAVEGMEGTDCFIGGEMGIANTTSAAALACAVLKKDARQMVGRGTGVTDAGLHHKAIIIDRALNKHKLQLIDPLAMLQYLGGFEIAALCGAYIACAQQSIPILVDGFICSVAALVAVRLNPSVRHWLLFSHLSEEQGHQQVLDYLQAQPLLKLAMRLGEGSGAATAASVLKMACALHNNMASFNSAQISRGESNEQ